MGITVARRNLRNRFLIRYGTRERKRLTKFKMAGRGSIYTLLHRLGNLTNDSFYADDLSGRITTRAVNRVRGHLSDVLFTTISRAIYARFGDLVRALLRSVCGMGAKGALNFRHRRKSRAGTTYARSRHDLANVDATLVNNIRAGNRELSRHAFRNTCIIQ